jgi:hypothetical protein
MAIQKRNDEQVSLLTSDFQSRYEGSFAWKTACSMYQALTGLRGFWPMSAVRQAGNAYDLSGNVRTLTYNGNPVYDFDGLAPYIKFDGTGDFLSRLDEAGLSITGTETYIAAGHRGLTCGGWFRPTDTTNNQGLIDKFYTAGQRGYSLFLAGGVGGDPVQFYISDDGTNNSSVSSATGYSANEWQFMAGRFNDSVAGAELAVWLNDEQTTAATARASIFDGTDDFAIGGKADGTSLFTGRASMCFLCAAALADATVWAIYQHTKALFKV